jgi:hypothetical protein
MASNAVERQPREDSALSPDGRMRRTMVRAGGVLLGWATIETVCPGITAATISAVRELLPRTDNPLFQKPERFAQAIGDYIPNTFQFNRSALYEGRFQASFSTANCPLLAGQRERPYALLELDNLAETDARALAGFFNFHPNQIRAVVEERAREVGRQVEDLVNDPDIIGPILVGMSAPHAQRLSGGGADTSRRAFVEVMRENPALLAALGITGLVGVGGVGVYLLYTEWKRRQSLGGISPPTQDTFTQFATATPSATEAPRVFTPTEEATYTSPPTTAPTATGGEARPTQIAAAPTLPPSPEPPTRTPTRTPTLTVTPTREPTVRPTEEVVPTLEQLGAKQVWESPVSTEANENYGSWNTEPAWDFKHEKGGNVQVFHDPVKGDVLRYTITQAGDVRAQLDEYGPLIEGNIAVDMHFRLGKGYRVIGTGGTANLLTTNAYAPNIIVDGKKSDWVLLGNVDFDSQRRLKLYIFDPATGNKYARYVSEETILDSDVWYNLQFRARSQDAAIQILLNGKVVKFKLVDQRGTVINNKEIATVPNHPNLKRATLADIHGGGYAYGVDYKAGGADCWIDNDKIRIYKW